MSLPSTISVSWASLANSVGMVLSNILSTTFVPQKHTMINKYKNKCYYCATHRNSIETPHHLSNRIIYDNSHKLRTFRSNNPPILSGILPENKLPSLFNSIRILKCALEMDWSIHTKNLNTTDHSCPVITYEDRWLLGFSNDPAEWVMFQSSCFQLNENKNESLNEWNSQSSIYSAWSIDTSWCLT